MNARRITCIALCLALCLTVMPGSAADKYWGGGNTDIADGTPIPYDTNALVGTWNATLKNWAASPNGATYTTFADGDYAQLGYYTNLNNCTIWLGSDFEFAGIQGGMNAITTGFNWMFDVRATSARTLTPASGGAIINIVAQDSTRGLSLANNVSLSGAEPLTKLGTGRLDLGGNNNGYSGVVNNRQGTVQLTTLAGASMNGVKQVNCIGRVTVATATAYGGNDFAFANFSVNASSPTDNKLADDLVVTLSRGGFTYLPTSTSTETVGRVVLNTWGTFGSSSAGGTGGALILADPTAGITRGPYGVGTLCMIVPADGLPRTKLKVMNGVPVNTLLPWLFTSRAEFCLLDGAQANTVTRIAATAAATDLSTWDTTYDNTSNVRIGIGTAVLLTSAIDANTTLKTLAWNNTIATTVSVADGVTLTLDAGAMAFAPNGSDPPGSQWLLGGNLTSGTGDLYINANDSGSSSILNIGTPIVGAINVIKSGIPQVRFVGSSSNTYSGTTYVNAGNLTLNKTGGIISIPGDLVIQNGGSVSFGTANQIATSANVTINEGGLLSSTQSQTYNGTLTINGGTLLFQNNSVTLNKPGTGLAFNGGYVLHNSTATGTLNLQTDVSYAGSSTTQARFERLGTAPGNIELDGGNRTFDIADSTTLPAGVPEMVVDTAIIPGSPAGGSITKTGTGTLQFTDQNSYTGGTFINGGVLQVSRLSAPAQSGLTAFPSQTGQGQALVLFNAPVAKNMIVRQPISGQFIASGRTVSRVLNDYEIICNGANINNVSTNVSVSAIQRAGSLGTGPVFVNNSGTLQIDAGVSVTNFTVIDAGGTAVVDGELASAVINSGTVQGNGTIVALTNATGGVLAPGASVGVMTIAGSAVLQNGSKVELEWSDGVTNDIVVVNGDFTAQGQPVIKVLNIGGTPTITTQVVLKVTGTYTGPVGGYQFELPPYWNAITAGGDLINLGGGNYGIAFIPEPGVIGLAALAVLALKRK